MKKLNVKSMTLLSSLLVMANVNCAPHFIWDNQEGVISHKRCSIERSRENNFRLSRYVGRGNKDTENLRNYSGVLQSHLVNSSLVKIIDGKSKNNYENIEIVGINTLTSARPNRWFSERGDKGYLYHESLLPMEDFVFEMNLEDEALTNAFDKESFIDSVDGVDLKEKLYLRVAADSSYYKLNCGEDTKDRDYLIFRAYQTANSESPMFLLGVSAQETSLFKSFGAIDKVTSMGLISDVGNEEALVEGELQSNIMLSNIEVEKENTDVEEDIIEETEVISVTRPKARPDSHGTTRPKARPEDLKTVSSMQKLVCIGTSTLNVRNESLDEVLFKAKLGEEVKIFQSWDAEEVTKTINGVKYTFNKVEFTSREEEDEKVGYVASSFIKSSEDCDFIFSEDEDLSDVEITGIDDPNCCDFPTVKKPTHSYSSGMRRFRAGRSGGRLHAACDLYRYENEPAKSVAPGKIISDLYYFYQGTYAVEIRHSGGFVARYGEITGKRPSGIRKNANVDMGQRIGYIGKVNSNCCRPMLHFELYSGDRTGSLSRSSGRYRRRSDLLDPTPYLNKWKNKAF